MKNKSKHVAITKSQLKKMFHQATGFCSWGEYERGDMLRDRYAMAGIDYCLNEFKIQNKKHIKKNDFIKLEYGGLFKAIRDVIDKSYFLYYNANGTFREDRYKASEINDIADDACKQFLAGLSQE